MTLEVGDVIATGTPSKLPEAAEKKRFLQAGDVMEITIEKLGILRNSVQLAPHPVAFGAHLSRMRA
jgi:2-keto-4-pentenoate hydratase/2-oxohepta-3-ene-1,7-dioic acid hydratase in catechol pathway